jgi:hypothetical protein
MLVKLIEVQRGIRGGTSSLREVYLNPQHIISVVEDPAVVLIAETVRLGLIEGTVFSKITIQEGSSSKSVTVVGQPSEIYNKIKSKRVLRG